jgi:hypothetical protein
MPVRPCDGKKAFRLITLTMILLANSDGASRGFNLGAGNVLASPFAVLFINLFADMKVTQQ